MLLFCLTLNVGFTTESAEVDNTWSRQDNYILCTHIKMETIQQNYIWKCISTVSHDKSSRNKERCGVNASCMLYSFKIVFPTRQVFSTSALSVVKPTYNVRQNNSIVDCTTSPINRLQHCSRHCCGHTTPWRHATNWPLATCSRGDNCARHLIIMSQAASGIASKNCGACQQRFFSPKL